MYRLGTYLLLYIFLFYAGILFPFIISAQKDVCVQDTIMHKEINMSIPSGFKKDLFSYGEGTFITYYYQDSTILTVFSGGMQRLPLLHSNNGYNTCFSDTICDRISSYGIKENKYWREDSYPGIRIYYEGVKKEKKSIFDVILNGFHFDDLSN